MDILKLELTNVPRAWHNKVLRIIPAYYKGPYRILHPICVRREELMVKIVGYLLPLAERIAHGFAKRKCGRT